MGKRQLKPPQPPRESMRIDTQAIANDLYQRGVITKIQAFGDMTWYQRKEDHELSTERR
jgi:hypothetical protein